MKNYVLKTEQRIEKNPILVVDKIGVIGEALSEAFSKDYLVFFATKINPQKENKKIIPIPFSNRIPKIPDNHYSKMFIIDDGQYITKESVFSFVKKAKEINSSLFFLGSLRNMDLEHADEIINSYSKAKVLIFGDLFDNDVLFDRNASITKFIMESRKNKKIKVPGNGLNLNYPISFADTIKLVLKAAYIDIPERAVLLFSKHPITDISLANTFQKIDPDISVDFEDSKKEKVVYFPKNSQYALSKYDLKKKLSELNLSDSDVNDINRFTKRNFEFKFIKPILFLFIACLFLLLLPLLATSVYSLLGSYQLGSAKKLADNGEFEKALNKTKNAERFYKFAIQTSGPLSYQADIIGKNEESAEIIKKIESGQDLSSAGSSLLEGAISLEKAYSTNSPNSQKEIQVSIESFKRAYSILEQLSVSKQIPEKFKSDFENILPVIRIIANSSDILPKAIGFDKEKSYLILFTDNSELRPGGGVVDSVGILGIKNGVVTKFEKHDVEELDKKLISRTDPPFLIRRYLPSDNFFLRDSTFSPDFVTSAVAAASIYKLESGSDVDGVIGINSDLENEIQTKLSKRNKNSFYEFIEKIGKGILEKDILFAFRDPDVQNLFISNNLSGSLADQRKTDANTINDYFGISEASVGKNKVSPMVSRSVVRKLAVDDNGVVNSEAKISFKNSQAKNSNEGTYKNYFQVILPAGSVISDISVGGKKVDIVPAITDSSIYERNGFESPDELEIEEIQEKDKSIFGFLVSIPPDSVKVVTVNYALPFRIDDSAKNLKYSLAIYKQPGIKSYLFDNVFEIHENLSILPGTSISKQIRKDEKFDFFISNN